MQPQDGQAGMWGPRSGSKSMRRWLPDLVPGHHHPTSHIPHLGGGNVVCNMFFDLKGHVTVLCVCQESLIITGYL